MGLLLTIVDHWKVNSHYYDRYQVLPSSNKHSRLHTPPFYEYYCWKKKEESWRAKGRERRAFWGASWAHWDTFVVWKNRKPDPIYQVQRSSGPFRRVVSAFFFFNFFFFWSPTFLFSSSSCIVMVLSAFRTESSHQSQSEMTCQTAMESLVSRMLFFLGEFKTSSFFKNTPCLYGAPNRWWEFDGSGLLHSSVLLKWVNDRESLYPKCCVK